MVPLGTSEASRFMYRYFTPFFLKNSVENASHHTKWGLGMSNVQYFGQCPHLKKTGLA